MCELGGKLVKSIKCNSHGLCGDGSESLPRTRAAWIREQDGCSVWISTASFCLPVKRYGTEGLVFACRSIHSIRTPPLIISSESPSMNDVVEHHAGGENGILLANLLLQQQNGLYLWGGNCVVVSLGQGLVTYSDIKTTITEFLQPRQLPQAHHQNDDKSNCCWMSHHQPPNKHQ